MEYAEVLVRSVYEERMMTALELIACGIFLMGILVFLGWLAILRVRSRRTVIAPSEPE